MNPLLRTAIESIVLERFKYHLQTMISKEIIDDGMFDVKFIEHFTGNMVLSLQAHVFGQRLDQIMWKAPANWKEAVKERFAPKWFLKKYPVKYQEFKVEPRVLYPQIKMPTEKHYIRLERIVDDGTLPWQET